MAVLEGAEKLPPTPKGFETPAVYPNRNKICLKNNDYVDRRFLRNARKRIRNNMTLTPVHSLHARNCENLKHGRHVYRVLEEDSFITMNG
jgi:hypothetical protein